MMKMIRKYFRKRFLEKRIENEIYLLNIYSVKRDMYINKDNEVVERMNRILLKQEIEIEELYNELESL